MSSLLDAVPGCLNGRAVPQNRAEVRVAVVGATVWQSPDEYVVVVCEGLAGAQFEPLVGVGAVLQMKRDGTAGVRAAGGRAAVGGPAVMEAHVGLGGYHRPLYPRGVFVRRAFWERAIPRHVLPLRE